MAWTTLEGRSSAWDDADDAMSEGPIEDNGLRFEITEEMSGKLPIIKGRLWLGKTDIGILRMAPLDYFPARKGSSGHSAWPVWAISNAKVRDDFQRKGIGKQMYLEMRDYLGKKYNAMMSSDVNRSPEAEALWKSFVKSGTAKYVPKWTPLPGGDSTSFDFYLMRRAA